MSGTWTDLASRLPRLQRAGQPQSSAGTAGRATDMAAQIWLPKAMLMALAALCLWQAVRLAWALMVPVGPLGDWQAKSAEIMPMAERKSLFSSFDPFFRSAASGPSAATVTSLGLSLFGINLNEATGGGSAIIAGEDGVQNSFAIGDEVAAGVTLSGLAFDHVILDRGGVQESLFMDQSGGEETAGVDAAVAGPASKAAPSATPTAPPAAGPAGVRPNGEISAEAVKSGLNFAPRKEGNAITGITVQPQGDGAIFRAAGLRQGDVIRAINGRPISSAADAASITSAMRPGARLSLDVERGASRVPIALFLAKS